MRYTLFQIGHLNEAETMQMHVIIPQAPTSQLPRVMPLSSQDCVQLRGEMKLVHSRKDASPKVFPWDPDNLSGASYKFYNFGNQTIFGLNEGYTFAEGNFTAAVSRAYTTE